MIETVEVIVEYWGEEYECEVEIKSSTDYNYGADADGNRGVPMDFIDSMRCISIFDSEDNEIFPGEKLFETISDLACEAAYREV